MMSTIQPAGTNVLNPPLLPQLTMMVLMQPSLSKRMRHHEIRGALTGVWISAQADALR